MNNAKKLPDAYAKCVDSNNYKLLQLANLLYTDLRCDLLKIAESRDLEYATGETLDRYGEMLGKSRNGDSDTKYRANLLIQIGKHVSGSDFNSVIKLISDIFGIPVEEVQISELEDPTITSLYNIGAIVSNISFEAIEKVGFTIDEAIEAIKSLLPAGVPIVNSSFAGTFQYGEHEGESDDKTGYNCGTLGKAIH